MIQLFVTVVECGRSDRYEDEARPSGKYYSDAMSLEEMWVERNLKLKTLRENQIGLLCEL